MGDEMHRDADQSRPPTTRRHLRRPVWLALLAVLVLLMGVVALAPTILSSRFALSRVVGAIDRSLTGSVAVRSVSLSWFGSPQIEGIQLADPQARRVLAIERVVAERALWWLLGSVLGGDAGKVRVQGLTADVVIDESGRSNLQRSLEPTGPRRPAPDRPPEPATPGPREAEPPGRLVPGAFTLELIDARLTVTTPDSPPAVFENLQATVSVAAPAGSVAFDLSGRSRQGELSGDFTARGHLETLVGRDGRLELERARGSVEATATALPVPGIDGLLGLNGVLTAALGDRLDLAATAEVGAGPRRVTATLRAPHLAADLDGRVADGTFTLARPAVVRFTATRPFVARLAALSDGTETLRLAEPVPLRLTVEQFRSRLADLDPSSIGVLARLEAEKPARLTGDPAIGDLTIRDLDARLETENAARSLAVALAAAVTLDGQPGRVEVNARLDDLFAATGRLQLDRVRADAVARVTNLPVGLVDRFTRQGGRLVEALGPTASLTATARSTDAARTEVEVTARTPRLTAEARLRVADTVEASGPITIDYRLSARLAARYLPEDAGVQLRPETPIRVRVMRLSVPLPGPGEPLVQPGKTVVQADVTVGPVTVSPPGTTERVTLDGIAARFGGASLAALEAGATAKAIIGGEPGPLREALGARADVSVRVTGGLGPGHAFTAREIGLEVEGERLTASLPLALTATRTVTLARPARVDLTVTPALLARLGLGPATRPVVGPARIEATLDRLEAPLDGLGLGRLRLAATATVTPARADAGLGLLLGRTVKLALRLDDAPKPEAGEAQVAVSIEADRLNADLVGVVAPGSATTFTLVKPATIDAVLTPEGLELFGVIAEGQPTIAGPTPVRIKVDRLAAAVQPFDPATVRMALTATVERVELAGDDRVRGASLADVVAALEVDGAAGTASAKLDGKASVPGQGAPSPLAATGKLSRLLRDGRLDPGQAAVEATAKLDGFPTAILGVWGGGDLPLVPLVGPSLQLDAAVALSGGETRRGTVDVKAASQNLSVEAGLTLGEVLGLRRPARVKLVLTPDAYAALTASDGARDAGGAARSGPYALAAPVTIDAVLNALAWPLGGDGWAAFDPARASVDLAVSASGMTFRDATGRGVAVTDLRGAVKATPLAGPIALRLTGKTAVTAPGAAAPGATGQLRVAGELRDLFTARGEFDTDNLTTDLSADLEEFPIAPIDAWLGQEGLLLATVGPTMNLAAKAQLQRMNGPVTLRATAVHANASLAGRLQDGTLTLAEPLVAEVAVTEPLGRRVLARINPIFETATTSETPIRFEISPQGTRIPVRPFAARDVVIERARLDLGKIELKTGGLLSGAVGLAQKLGRWRTTGKNSMTAWFTPLLWEMREGRIRYTRRLDLLLDGSQHLATWGTVDQANDRVELVLAIMPETLDKIFDIENVGPNDAFRIPVTGSIASPSVDWTRAGLDLGRLKAQAKLGEKGRGRLGELLGGLARGALGGASGPTRGALPPPSVEPLPWETAPAARDARTPEESRRPEGIQPRGAPQEPPPAGEDPKKPRPQDLIEETLRKGLEKLFK